MVHEYVRHAPKVELKVWWGVCGDRFNKTPESNLNVLFNLLGTVPGPVRVSNSFSCSNFEQGLEETFSLFPLLHLVPCLANQIFKQILDQDQQIDCGRLINRHCYNHSHQINRGKLPLQFWQQYSVSLILNIRMKYEEWNFIQLWAVRNSYLFWDNILWVKLIVYVWCAKHPFIHFFVFFCSNGDQHAVTLVTDLVCSEKIWSMFFLSINIAISSFLNVFPLKLYIMKLIDWST